MPFEINNIVNGSQPKDEVIILKATADYNNLEDYAIVDKTFFADGEESNKFRHIYRFATMVVKKDEYVFLYSGKGTPRTYTDKDGDIIHTLYWNSEECIWNNDGNDQATLIKYKNVSRKIVPRVDE